MATKSVMVDDMSHCLICGRSGAEEHHVIFGTANRAKSEKYGLKVPLCGYDHREGPNAPHKNKAIDLTLKFWAQSVFIQKAEERGEDGRALFYQEFGRFYY